MIRTVLFDVGNVLADFKWRECLDTLSISESEAGWLAENIFKSRWWDAIDRGEKTAEEIRLEICREKESVPGCPEDLPGLMMRLFDAIPFAVHQNAYAPGLVKALKEQGLSVYILSNYNGEFLDRVKDTFAFLPLTDGQLFSYEVKAVKPEPEIYEALLARFPIVPEETLFFDDKKVNLEAAEQIHMKTCLVTGYDSILEGLKKWGISI